MENKNTKIHPLMAAAAVSVILVSMTGIAAITGLIPNSHGDDAAQATSTQLASASGSAAAPSSSVPLAGSVGAAAAASSPAALVEGKRANVETMPARITPVEETEPAKSEAPAPKPKAQPAPKPKATTQPAPRSYAGESAPVAQAPMCAVCGRVESVQPIQQAAKPSGLGIAAGAVLGGVLGNQVGDGNGRKLATIAGAVGGGYAGNEVEKRTNATTSYQVRVRMEDGSIRTFPYQNQPAWTTGDRVRVVNGQLTSRA